MKPIRSDVQGLRAIAVILVVAYHLGLFFPAGFLGVDVFFVISGFVIGQILLNEVTATGKVRWGRFYSRRFLRLVPALAIVLGVIVVISTVFFSSDLLHSTATGSAIAAAFGLSNFLIAELSGGYFGLAPSLNPLLHTWSLSVEWQFYLLFPLVVALALRGGMGALEWRNRLFIGVLALSALSLFIALAMYPGPLVSRVEIFGFYSFVPRLWEFGLGFLVVLVRDRWPQVSFFGRWAGLAGLSMVLGSAFFLSDEVQTPGLSTLAPTVGTALIIWSGSREGSFSLIHRVLSARPLAWVGDLSYSIYLWHWPVIFFAKEIGLPNNPQRAVGVVLVTMALSIASYYLVENRFRVRRNESRNATTVAAIALGCAPLVLVSLWAGFGKTYWSYAHERGWAETISGSVGHDDFHELVASQYSECEPANIRDSAERWGSFLRCQQSKLNSPQSVAIMGDSHAEHLFPGVAEVFESENVVYFQYDRFFVNRAAPQVEQIIDHVVTSDSIHTVIMTSYWARIGLPEKELSELTENLVTRGKTVVWTNDIPIPPFRPEDCKTSKHLLAERSCSFHTTVDDHLIGSDVRESLRRIVDPFSRALFVDTYNLFCDGNECSLLTPGGTLGYRDNDHLNTAGSRFVARAIAAELSSG